MKSLVELTWDSYNCKLKVMKSIELLNKNEYYEVKPQKMEIIGKQPKIQIDNSVIDLSSSLNFLENDRIIFIATGLFFWINKGN